jgi:putative acetyltransferase
VCWAGRVEMRAEEPGEHAAVAELQRQAFGPGPVPDLVAALRAGGALSRVAVAGDEVVGHVMLSHAWLDAPERLVDVLVLSPLGVLPARQRRGVGTALVADALAVAGAHGAPLVFLEGSPAYYGKRGFERADELGFTSPSPRIPPPAFQVHRLPGYTPALTGRLVYPDVFWRYDCVGLR